MSPTKVQSLREKVSLDSAPDGVMWVDSRGQILLVNPAIETLTGYPEDELVGQNVTIFLPTHLHDKHAESMRGYFHAPRARAMGHMDMTLLRRDGKLLPVDISLGHWVDEGEQFAIAYIRDLTERKRFEDSLRHRASHDDLTGLPNRAMFRDQLDQALAHAKRNARHVAVIFLDLDDFKSVNDTFGHMVGNELLSQVGQRLNSALRENDFVARMGGDEFAILVSDMASCEEAINLMERLLLLLDPIYDLQQQQVHCGGSVGLALYPDDAQDTETLLRYADMAMYKAKHAGRATYACYSPELDQLAQENMQLHFFLKKAIANNKLRLHYQPQVDVQSGTIVGAEALLRWHDEILGEIPPSKFIPVAETTGLIFHLSEWVLETACKQIAAWKTEGTPLRIAVNFSAQQFHRRSLLDEIHGALQRTGAQAQLLEIEITETVAMKQPDLASRQLQALVDLGCSVVLDDFGTGYSSLAYVKSLPINTLKIDREFIKNIPDNLDDIKISKSIAALAHSFDLTVVAEGVETEEQLEFLRACGCETYQGWLFSKAIEPSELSALLRAQLRRPHAGLKLPP